MKYFIFIFFLTINFSYSFNLYPIINQNIYYNYNYHSIFENQIPFRIDDIVVLPSVKKEIETILTTGDLINFYLDTAKYYLYVREIYKNGKPINRSKEIDEWNIKAGAPVGSYWCMAFVYNMVKKVYDAFEIKNPLKKTPSVSQQLRYANLIGSGLKVIQTRKIGIKAKKGDIFCIKSGDDHDSDIGKLWSGHTGFCKTNQASNGKVDTREGNTNKAGSSNGDRVADRTRKVSEFLATIRLPENEYKFITGE